MQHSFDEPRPALIDFAPEAILDLDAFPGHVHNALQAFFQEQSASIANIGPDVEHAVALLADFVLGGGKRIRPMCAWVGFAAAGGFGALEAASSPTADYVVHGPEEASALLRATSALEFMQACALIHDDIIDKSDTRRGKPTVHRKAEATHSNAGWLGSHTHYGQAVAILVGDLALCWADDMLRDSGLPSQALSRALPAWRGMRTEVIGGQLLDIALEASGAEDIEGSWAVNRFKTASYTIERPLHLGAALAGASEDVIQALRTFGQDIGIAFQLRDDLLGVFGDPKVTGKPSGDDLREGKRTVLLAHALTHAAPAVTERIRAGIGKVSTDAEVAALAEDIKSTGAVDFVEETIQRLETSGIAALAEAPIPQPAYEALIALATRATKRGL